MEVYAVEREGCKIPPAQRMILAVDMKFVEQVCIECARISHVTNL